MKPTLLALFCTTLAPIACFAQTYSGGGSYDGGSYSRELTVVGLTSDERLISFQESSPGSATTIGRVSGLSGGDTFLVGIDYRVQDGKLYGVGNAGGIYSINTSNALATPVSRLTVALSGTYFGVDFNPAADRLRIISDNGQNLRHNINAGGVTVVDGTLNYTSGTPALKVTGAAYTNNDLDATTATTLYDIDTNLDQVVLQSPPNNGSLAATGKLTVDAAPPSTAAGQPQDVGFDIYSTIRNGVTVEVQALASLTSPAGAASLYSVKLPTGKASLRGGFKSTDRVVDIAIPLNQL